MYQHINGSATTHGFGTDELPGTEDCFTFEFFPAFGSEEQVPPVPVHLTELDGHGLFLTTAQQ